MSIRKLHKFTQGPRLRVTLALVLLISIFQGGWVCNVAAQTAKESAPPSAGGPKEGIKVHGHWTIEVHNPDGTLVERREFENALTDRGSSMLAVVMHRGTTVGAWMVILGSQTASVPCPGNCVISEPTLTTGQSHNLAVTDTLSTTSPASLVLAGSVTASQNGTISSVSTTLFLCDASVAPSGCISITGAGPFPFSQAILDGLQGRPSPVNVVAGQIVQATVVISFS